MFVNVTPFGGTSVISMLRRLTRLGNAGNTGSLESNGGSPQQRAPAGLLRSNGHVRAQVEPSYTGNLIGDVSLADEGWVHGSELIELHAGAANGPKMFSGVNCTSWCLASTRPG
eukprot:CAMPEP_0117616992 /NCGR_PEP_ID=MMETSP0784-20121206/85367_1 /TAXON_ID=39447 /ORGANISM="" /LENGTH=113 /DNA_ID=CAMNT_0005420829 /DNA_START=377 /DNA_END=718 /DNA_ORIENTATION=+